MVSTIDFFDQLEFFIYSSSSFALFLSFRADLFGALEAEVKLDTDADPSRQFRVAPAVLAIYSFWAVCLRYQLSWLVIP